MRQPLPLGVRRPCVTTRTVAMVTAPTTLVAVTQVGLPATRRKTVSRMMKTLKSIPPPLQPVTRPLAAEHPSTRENSMHSLCLLNETTTRYTTNDRERTRKTPVELQWHNGGININMCPCLPSRKLLHTRQAVWLPRPLPELRATCRTSPLMPPTGQLHHHRGQHYVASSARHGCGRGTMVATPGLHALLHRHIMSARTRNNHNNNTFPKHPSLVEQGVRANRMRTCRRRPLRHHCLPIPSMSHTLIGVHATVNMAVISEEADRASRQVIVRSTRRTARRL